MIKGEGSELILIGSLGAPALLTDMVESSGEPRGRIISLCVRKRGYTSKN